MQLKLNPITILRLMTLLIVLATTVQAFSQSQIYEANGNVGIGMSNPIAKFEVVQPGSGQSVRFSQDNGQRVMEIGTTGMSFSTTGVYGSNAWSATAMFEVYNHFAAPARSGIYFKGVFNQSGDAFLYKDVNGNTLYKVSAGGGGFFAGNTGIGTTAIEGYKLAVNGSAIFTKAVVRSYGDWPDYVFKKSYLLPRLSDVEKYIKQHNHLPGMPSALDIETNGIDLGNNQSLLLKKVEELFLYLLAQNKKLEQQEKDIQDLKVKLAQK